MTDRTLGFVGFAVIVAFMLSVVTGVLRNALTGEGDQVVRAQFADTRQLKQGDPVRIDGVRVGTVDRLALDGDGRSSTVTMLLEPDKAGALHRDAKAHLRFRTLLGGNFAVELERGSDRAGDLGETTIPVSRTDGQIELDDITALLQGKALQGLKTMPDELARALRDPQTPTSLLEQVAEDAPSLRRGLRAAQGQQPEEDLATLVNATARTVGALNRPGDRLRQTVAGASSLVSTTAARRTELRTILDRTPGLLTRTDQTLADLRGTLGLADPLLRKVRASAPDVAPTVRALRGTVVPADRLLDDAVPLLRSLRPAVRSLAGASKRGTPLLRELAPSLDLLDRKILPYTDEDQPDTGLSTAELIGPAAAALSAIGAFVDDAGRLVRFPATSGNNAFYLPCNTYFNDPTQQQAIVCQTLSSALKALFARQRGSK
jgi:phospholipid/cholesterol/gamma-HCH transport system substrate-binding protein